MLIRQNGKKECRGTEIDTESRAAAFPKPCTWTEPSSGASVLPGGITKPCPAHSPEMFTWKRPSLCEVLNSLLHTPASSAGGFHPCWVCVAPRAFRDSSTSPSRAACAGIFPAFTARMVTQLSRMEKSRITPVGWEFLG